MDIAALRAQLEAEESFRKERNKWNAEKGRLENLIETLRENFELEQEWKPYEDKDNVTDEEYRGFAKEDPAYELSDEAAKEILQEWFGFDVRRITIHRTVPKYEINRHQQLRLVGEKPRKPIYFATDYNYIRFDCGRVKYELYDGELNIYRD